MYKIALSTLLIISCSLSNAQITLTDLQSISGAAGCNPRNLSIYKNELYFYSDQGIRHTDGINTPSLFPVNIKGHSSMVDDHMVELNGILYHAVDYGGAPTLYAYDGINPSALAYTSPSTTFGPSDPVWMTALNNKLYFFASTSVSPNIFRLWTFDPATKIAKIIAGYGHAGFPQEAKAFCTVYNNKLYYSSQLPSNGAKSLFVCDPVNDSVMEVSGIQFGTSPYNIRVFDNKLYFMGLDSVNSATMKLFVYDGNNPPKLITGSYEIPVYNSISSIARLYDNIYFAAKSGSSAVQLYKYSITAGTVSLAYTINTVGDAYPKWLIAYGNKIYFCATEPATGEELWSLDGINPPAKFADIYPGTMGSSISSPIVMNNILYFAASNLTTGSEIYKLTDPKAGITSISFPGTITIYPNPTQNTMALELTLTQAEKLSISVTDIQGRVVYNIPAKDYTANKHNINIPMQSLSSGTYYYHIINTDNRLAASGKLVKE